MSIFFKSLFDTIQTLLVTEVAPPIPFICLRSGDPMTVNKNFVNLSLSLGKSFLSKSKPLDVPPLMYAAGIPI